ncbi:phenylalanine--tRNA ligase subunit beta [Candidatus Micrarchaeota archaeon]|nr:phenylalanine--tRNA ligase subunit beta [Candidatus Micrarchaeota archaeon]
MAVVEYTYQDIKKLINLPKEKIIEDLSNLGAPSEIDPATGNIISEITPNRPDWYNIEGLVRSLKAYTHKKNTQYKVRKSNYIINIDPSVSKIRPYTVGVVVKGLKFDDQKVRDIILLQEKLMSTLGRKVKKFGIGFYPLNAIKFPIKYTTKKPTEIKYRPLGFEREMSAEEILSMHKKGIENGHFIKNHPVYPVFLDADEKIMCLIPIVNSAETGKIDENTREIFAEVTGMELNTIKAALNIIACTLADMGGEIYQVQLNYAKEKLNLPDLEPTKMKLKQDSITKILGVKFSEEKITEYLTKMGYEYHKGEVKIPPYRADILGEIDIIEDIAIAHGFNEFEPTVPNFFSSGKRNEKEEKVGQIMRGMGFSEIKTFILTNEEKIKLSKYSGNVLEVANASNEEYSIIRPNMISSFLEVFATNKTKGLPQRFYEIGVTKAAKEKTNKRLVFAMMDKKLEFSEFRGYLQSLIREMGKKIKVEKIEEDSIFESKMRGKIITNKEIGHFGKVNSETTQKIGLDFEIYICELDFEELTA